MLSLRELGLPGETVVQVLMHRCRETPDHTFMRHKRRGIWQRFTYAQVVTRVGQIACGLSRLGLQRGDTVAIVGNNEPELFYAEYAALAQGARVVCLYPDMLPAEVAYILKDADARLVVAEDQEQVDKLLEIRPEVPGVLQTIYWDSHCMWQYDDPWLMPLERVEALGGPGVAAGEFEQAVAAGTADDWAVISYTSGTTGQPKGGILTHRQLFDNALRMLDAMGAKPHAEYLSFISPAWAAEQFLGITIGVLAPLLINFPEEPETVLPDLREIGVEIVAFSPRQWEGMVANMESRMMQSSRLRQRLYRWALAVGRRTAAARMAGRDLSLAERFRHFGANLLVLGALRDRLGLSRAFLATSTGAAMSPDVFRLFHGLGVGLRNVFGATEVGMLAMHSADRFDPETVGEWAQVRPGLAPPLEWRVDEEGGLRVRGGTLFAGYCNNPTATREKFDADGYYMTGDAVHLRPDGQLVYLDRVADLRQLKCGQKYPPQYIETRLRFSPFIRDVAVLGDSTREYVTALIDIDPETVGEWAKSRRVKYTTHADLTQKPEALALIQGEVEQVNSQLAEGMQVRRFAILPKPIDPDDAEMTRSRKLRRELFHQRYADMITALYSGAEAFDAEVPVRYRSGQTGVVRVPVRICSLKGV